MTETWWTGIDRKKAPRRPKRTSLRRRVPGCSGKGGWEGRVRPNWRSKMQPTPRRPSLDAGQMREDENENLEMTKNCEISGVNCFLQRRLLQIGRSTRRRSVGGEATGKTRAAPTRSARVPLIPGFLGLPHIYSHYDDTTDSDFTQIGHARARSLTISGQ